MATQNQYVPAAEAAFIGGVTAPQMNRLVDEHLVPRSLLAQEGGARRFARLTAAFAKFFFDTDSVLVVGARRQALTEITYRIEQLKTSDQVFALRAMPREIDWKVGNLALGTVSIDFAPYVTEAMARAKDVDKAEQLVIEDPEIMGGLPCFAGTRVPIENVVASLDKGISKERLIASYPFLTEAHLDAAVTYTKVHPRRGRPRGNGGANASLAPRITKVVRQARA